MITGSKTSRKKRGFPRTQSRPNVFGIRFWPMICEQKRPQSRFSPGRFLVRSDSIGAVYEAEHSLTHLANVRVPVCFADEANIRDEWCRPFFDSRKRCCNKAQTTACFTIQRADSAVGDLPRCDPRHRSLHPGVSVSDFSAYPGGFHRAGLLARAGASL
jgi:hypothetical protein